MLKANVKINSRLSDFVFSLIPHFRGNWLLTPPIFLLLGNKASIILDDGKNKMRVPLNISDPSQFSQIKTKKLDLGTATAINDLLKVGDTFVDIGANWGYFSWIASIKNCNTIAVEPDDRECKYLNKIPNVNVINKAVDYEENKTILFSKPLIHQHLHPDHRFAMRHYQVTTTTIDAIRQSINRPINLIKIDTDGMDFAILKGAVKTLATDKPNVIVEVSESSVTRNFGYEPSDIYKFMFEHEYQYAYCIIDDRGVEKISIVPKGQFLVRNILFTTSVYQF